MYVKVLFVKSEMNIINRFKDMIASYKNVFDVSYAGSAKDAISHLEQKPFDNIVTGLEIPKLSEGFLFLSRVREKKIRGSQIIVIANDITQSLKQSMDSMGIVNLFKKADLDNVLRLLLRLNNIDTASGKNNQDGGSITRIDMEKVKKSLNHVMGPVGSIIFDDVNSRWKNQNNPQELIELIKSEIGEHRKFQLFMENI